MKPNEILDLPMDENDSGATTIKRYLKALLLELWAEGEGFSGKRPFGNSGWDYDLMGALVKGGAIQGSFSEQDGEYMPELENFDREAGEKAVVSAIKAL